MSPGRPTVVVVGLGPAGPGYLTEAARSAIRDTPRRFLRTAVHPSATEVQGAESFDHLYEESESFDAVYAGMVQRLVDEASSEGRVLLAVPGSPTVAESAVTLLRRDGRVDVELVAGTSFLDLAWQRLAVDPVEEGVKLVDASSFAVDAAGERGPFLVAQCWSPSVLSSVKLAVEGAGEARVTVLRHLGLPDEEVQDVAWEDIDREVEADHLTSLYIPTLAAPVGPGVVRLAELVRTLREHCPWDRRQTHESLERHLVEETYEVIEAIERLDGSPASYGDLEEELGDLLFQVLFHAQLAQEAGQFGLADVVTSVHDKLVRRHPHVFGDVDAETADQVMSNWERIKADEKSRTSLMDGIPRGLPALLEAAKVDRKLRGVGLDPLAVVAPLPGDRRAGSGEGAGPASGGRADGTGRVALERALGPSPGREEIGAALAELSAIAARHGIDAEAALRAATARTVARLRELEARLEAEGEDIATSPEARRRALWQSG